MPKGQTNDPDEGKIERRRYKRIKKNFILTYYDKNTPHQKFEITQLKNISLGGICFVTTKKFEPGTAIGIELKTPYLADTTYLEGYVLESHEKVKNMIFETRLKFALLNPQAEFLLSKVIEFFMNGEKDNYA